jgi:3-oxoacyl-[acyl-carrier protein] reductase
MFKDLNGKKVLVTGASSGIGACTAELFAGHGATVGVHYHSNIKGAESVAARIRKTGGEVFLLGGDLLDTSRCDTLIDEFIDLTRGIDILVNNAGTFHLNNFLSIPLQSWNDAVSLHLTAPFLLARNAFVFMKENGGGRIINISSIAAKYGGSDESIHYGAAKAGLDAVTKSLARAGAPYKILVNSIQPGVIATNAHRKIGRESLDDRVSKIPLKRAGTPFDVARLCIFLGSDCGSYITGQIFGVTGGE